MSVMELNSNERMRINSRYQEVRRGDIYYANIGENMGSIQSGIRPVMIVQNDFGNMHSPTVLVAILSSKINKAKLPTHVIITKEECKGLTYDSFVGMEQLFTLNKYQLGSYIGHIMNDKIDKAIAVSLGLAKVERVDHKLKEIKDNIRIKVDAIKVLDIVISHHLDKGRDINQIKDDIQERKIRIKDLISYCEETSQDVGNYYDVECIKKGDKNIRMVG